APAIGPTIHTYQSFHRPVASAGPNHLVTLNAAPVHGPRARTPNEIVRPIVSPAVFANGPRSSIAVENTAHTRKNVPTASIRIALPTANPGASCTAPPIPESKKVLGTRYFKRYAAATAPAN